MISRRWVKPDRLWSMLKDAASVVGFFAVAVAIVQFFPSLLPISQFLQRDAVLMVLAIGSIGFGIFHNSPQNRFIFKVKERDAEIGLWVGNVQDLEGALVVPVNSEFDVFLNGSVKSAQSVKSMAITNYFNGDHAEVKRRIQKQLKSKIYSDQKDGARYKLGTTVSLESDSGKRFYFVANSHKINGERVEANEVGLYASLNGLWAYISQHGAKENLVIPLMGTGNGRLRMPRQEVYEEIVRSFIASCAGKVYCDRLTIVIREEDVTRYQIDIEHLAEFTRAQAEYAGFTKSKGPAVGTAVE